MQIAQTLSYRGYTGYTVIGVTKVANERYLPYLQLCENAFYVNVMYWRCKSGPKLG